MLSVPVAAGAVVLPGEAVATIGGGGIFLRIAVPERHAALSEGGRGDRDRDRAGAAQGTLARLYPLIENGRVIADVEVPDLPESFVDARVLVRLPVAPALRLWCPRRRSSRGPASISSRVDGPEGAVLRTVVLGQRRSGRRRDDRGAVGFVAGDRVVAQVSDARGNGQRLALPGG